MNRLPSAFWVLGTDTGVGKTFVSAWLTRALAERGMESDGPVRYWKPIASGLAEGSDDGTVASLVSDLVDTGRLVIVPSTFAFREPLSPHLAARLEGARVEPEQVLAELADLRGTPAPLVIEGVGGLLVPLTDDGFLLADLVRASGLPCVLVARSTLGTINHTLLTLEALRARDLPLAGAIMNGPANPENRRAIERFGAVEVLAEVPWVHGGELELRNACRRALALDDAPELDQ